MLFGSVVEPRARDRAAFNVQRANPGVESNGAARLFDHRNECLRKNAVPPPDTKRRLDNW
ncbi:hypothetical protein [Caballeronia sp. BR00000012568055]|uniref:hypothetical protein n=1 Tax=Caballeronia sp. BR00000012568055 TaxID=2918761 RepID=UPI0023F7971B|nr:hypothetical protein [Caballeronia sp. BR00000012568055]